ncbi:uncharacterized protein [Temnothorax longispinosus]|uniref:uncharacterized protein isoform X2 n=1 Tax=Temnothorax longispinosus TaxID=300112 RepID=UPI003A990F19
MCERSKTIKRCYKALQYEINKQEALKKISTLHCELKFKDTNNFSDRFSQTTSIIEKNLTVFKSACDHVDIVTTILDFLHIVGVRLMFKDESCTYKDMVLIYMMYIVCDEREISSFLQAALLNNSRLEYVDIAYRNALSHCVHEMVVLEDSDLYAVISYLRITPSFLLKINRIYIQESIIQKFIYVMEKYFKHSNLVLSISVFHAKEDLHLFPTYFASLTKMYMMSIWSEDIAAAKELATILRRDITFINAHFEFCSDITFTSNKWVESTFDFCRFYGVWKDKDEDEINANEYTGSRYDLFYYGAWQKPVKNTYWIHDDNIYANATRSDILRCVGSASDAAVSWSSLPIVSRKKILENLASTLECNGKFLLADTVLKWLKSSNINNTLKCQDERLELTNFRGSKNVVSIFHPDEVVSFGYLTLSLMIGNCVIVLFNGHSCSLAPYFSMFSTAGIPSGVINLLSKKEMFGVCFDKAYEPEEAFKHCTSINHIILPLK